MRTSVADITRDLIGLVAGVGLLGVGAVIKGNDMGVVMLAGFPPQSRSYANPVCAIAPRE